MFASLKATWNFLISERIAAEPVESVLGPGYCEVRVHQKHDGSRWVTLVTKGGQSKVYVPLEPEQALSLARVLTRLAEVAKSQS